MNRDLDGIYFRIKREGKFDNICFSDLTVIEQNQIMEGRNIEWLKSLCIHLAERLKCIGETFDITVSD